MKIVTSSDYKFRLMVNANSRNCLSLGYKLTVFDLGGLGLGERYMVNSDLVIYGHYHCLANGWKSKAMHKPGLVRTALDGLTIYLDADTLVVGSLDVQGDYDIGVTVRRPQCDEDTCAEHAEVRGMINAGVLFFNDTLASRKFIDEWANMTLLLGNDQWALNSMINPSNRVLLPGENLLVGVTKIHTFNGELYNWYYFPEKPSPDTKILHFKTGKRNFFPKYLLGL
jgi:hypothetical protein